MHSQLARDMSLGANEIHCPQLSQEASIPELLLGRSWGTRFDKVACFCTEVRGFLPVPPKANSIRFCGLSALEAYGLHCTAG